MKRKFRLIDDTPSVPVAISLANSDTTTADTTQLYDDDGDLIVPKLPKPQQPVQRDPKGKIIEPIVVVEAQPESVSQPAVYSVPIIVPKKQQKNQFRNRFDIQPGSRWDGVDRSNGYERRLLKQPTQIKDYEAYSDDE